MIRSRRLRLVPLLALTCGCATTGAVPRPFPAPGNGPDPGAVVTAPKGPAAPEPLVMSMTGAAAGYALVGTALALRGSPYRLGGTDPAGFDCSGLVQYVFAQHGLRLPRTVVEQARAGTAVPLDQLEPGDLLFFATSDAGASHVAIAIGGDQFVHAPSSQGEVRVERLSAPYWRTRFLEARRPW